MMKRSKGQTPPTTPTGWPEGYFERLEPLEPEFAAPERGGWTTTLPPYPYRVVVEAGPRSLTFLSPPKFVVGTTASEAAYRLMVSTKGGLSAFWEEAIAGFDGDLEALVRAAAFEEERRRGRNTSGVRSANGRVSQELHERVVELEQALKGIKRWSRAKALAGLAKLLLQRRGEWMYPLNL